MSLTTLPGRRTAGTPDPAEVITITIGGRTFRAGRRTAAHLLVTFAAFAQRFPDLQLLVAQPCFNTGYEPSAGTHDGDGVLDFYVARNGSVLASTDADYWAVQRFMRELGWAAFFRDTGTWAARSAWHLHAASLGCPGPVGIYVPGQVADYEATPPRNGLAGHAADDTWHPGDIPATCFDYPAWVRDQEDLNIMDADTRDFLNRKFDRVLAQERATRAAVTQTLDLIEDLATSNDEVKARVTKSKREILASIAKVDAELDAEDRTP